MYRALREKIQKSERSQFTKKQVESLVQECEDEFKEMRNSEKKSNPGVMTIGKHKGQKISDILTKDKPYLEWLLKQPWLFADLKQEIQKNLAL
jgi:hypothetical protein